MSRTKRYVLIGAGILGALVALFFMFGLSPYADSGPVGKVAVIQGYLNGATDMIRSRCEKRTLAVGMTSADLGVDRLYGSANRYGQHLVRRVFVQVETLNRIIVGADLNELQDNTITFWPRTVAPAGRQLVFLHSCGEKGFVGLEYWSDLPEQYTRWLQLNYRRASMPLQPTR